VAKYNLLIDCLVNKASYIFIGNCGAAWNLTLARVHYYAMSDDPLLEDHTDVPSSSFSLIT